MSNLFSLRNIINKLLLLVVLNLVENPEKTIKNEFSFPNQFQNKLHTYSVIYRAYTWSFTSICSRPELELQVIILYSNACNESNATKSCTKKKRILHLSSISDSPTICFVSFLLLPQSTAANQLRHIASLLLVAGCIKNKRLWPALNLEWNWRKYQKFIQWQMQHKQTRNKQWTKKVPKGAA